MVPPIPVEDRREIVRLRDDGHSFKDIREILLKRGLKYSVIGIGNCYQKILKSGSVEAQPKQKYSKETLDRIKAELQKILEENSDLTGQQQIDELKRRLGVSVSMDAVGRYRRLLGWKVMPNVWLKENQGKGDGDPETGSSHSNSNNSSNISMPTTTYPDQNPSFSGLNTHSPLENGNGVGFGNGVKVAYYNNDLNLTCIKSEIDTSNSINPINTLNHMELQGNHFNFCDPHFSLSSGMGMGGDDEHTIMTLGEEGNSNQMGGCGVELQPQQQQLQLQLQQKSFGPSHVFTSASFIKAGGGKFKYQVWAGISFQGATSICIWDGQSRIKANFYCTTILEKFFLPFREERYPHRMCVLVQNNGAIYKANESRDYMQLAGIECEQWSPAELGGEMNPMDKIWEEINVHVRDDIKPATLDDLREAICNFWATQMTDAKCRNALKSCPFFSEF